MKTYVTVNSKRDEGYVFIKSLTWPDGRVFQISSSRGVGEVSIENGVCYRHEIRIGQHTRYIYEDGDKWFVVT